MNKKLLSDDEVRKLMDRARRTNRERDGMDRAHGSATPAEAGPGEMLLTAMAAIGAGIRAVDWSCVAEALAMLEELHVLVDPGHREYRLH